MARAHTPPDLVPFVDRLGEDLARLFLLLVPDPLDAEDLFYGEVLRLPADRSSGAVSEAAVFRSALVRARGHLRALGRSHYRPVEVDDGVRGAGSEEAALLRAWSSVPLAERCAIALLVGFERPETEVAAALGKKAGDPIGAAEHGLLLFERERAGRKRLPAAPRGRARGESLRKILAAPEGAGIEEGEVGDRVARETLSAVRAFRRLHGAVLRASEWKKMQKRVLREAPARGGGLLLVDSFETPLGWFGAASLEGVVVGTVFGKRNESDWLRETAPLGVRRARTDPGALRAARRELLEYFAGRRKRFTFPYRLMGASSFRAAVLDACARIPYGTVRCYKQLAEAVGRPGAMRAVGGALSRNPLPVVVPCHRVIARTGSLGGFSGGVALKKKLLSLEGMGDLFHSRP